MHQILYKKSLMNRLGLFVLLLMTNTLLAQSTHEYLLSGTDAYQSGDFEGSETAFRAAEATDNTAAKVYYNLGNALFRQKKYDQAALQFDKVAASSSDNKLVAQAFYNKGNTQLEKAKSAGTNPMQQAMPGAGKEQADPQKLLKNAITSYQEALKRTPRDYDAKNNLALAYRMLRQQQQQQQQQQQENKDNKDNKDDKDNKEDKQDQKENQDQQQNKDQKQEDSKSKPAEKQPMKKDEVDRLMDMIEQEDKRVQEKLMQKMKAKQRTTDKAW